MKSVIAVWHRLSTLFLLGSLIVVLMPGPAWADQTLDRVQITCSPGWGYFSLRTLQMQNTNVDFRDEKKFENDSGLYAPKAIADHPFVCKLDTGTISVEAHIISESRGTGMCGALGRFDLVIKKNGDPLYHFDPYITTAACLTTATHLVEIVPPDALRDCLIPDGKGQASCSYP